MIRILDGDPGSGKSYHAVQEIVQKLEAGGHVVTNLPLFWDRIKAYCARPRYGWFGVRPGVVLEDAQMTLLTDAQAQDFWSHMPQGTLECPVEGYFDELQNLFNSRNWAETQKKHGQVLKFISHHRHYHTNLTLLTQDRGNIDKQFRVMCSEFWEHLDMNGWDIIGLRWPLPQFLRKKYGKDQKHRQRFQLVWKDKTIWTLYDSHNKIEGIELKRSVSRLQLAPAQVSWYQRLTHMLKSWVVIMVVVVAVVVWTAGRFRSSGVAAPVGFVPRGVVAVGRPPVSQGRWSGGGVEPGAVQPRTVTEELRYAEGDYYRRTTACGYTLNRMCPKGMVVAMDDDMVSVRGFDGVMVYVVLSGGSAAPERVPSTPAPAVYVSSSPAASATPYGTADAGSLSARESARLDAYLHTSIAENGTMAPAVTPSQGSGPVAGGVPYPGGANRLGH